MGEHKTPPTMKGMYAKLSCCPVSTGLLLVLVPLVTVNCSPAAQARSDEDAWLAVINSGSGQALESAPQARQDTELYQFEQPESLGVQQPAGRVVQQASERAAQQPIDIVPQPYDRVSQQQLIREQEQQPIERFAQQPAQQQRLPQQNPVRPVRPGRPGPPRAGQKQRPR